MTLQEIKNALDNIARKNCYSNIKYQSVKGDYRKETEMTIRFVEYSHISGVQVAGKPNPNETHLTDYPQIVYNSKNNEYYLMINPTKSDTHKPKSKFYYQDQEIDRATYESVVKPRPFNNPPVFRKNIKDIISLG